MEDGCEVSVGQGTALVTQDCVTPGSSSKLEAFAPVLKAPLDMCMCVQHFRTDRMRASAQGD